MSQGRPSSYTEEIGKAICDRIIEGRSLRKICEDADMPMKGQVLRWVAAIPSFRDQYAKAMDIRAELMFDEILDIADDGANDYIPTEEGQSLNYEHIQRSRLRVDTRKWVVSKMLPKKYGAQKFEGGDGQTPLDDPNEGV